MSGIGVLAGYEVCLDEFPLMCHGVAPQFARRFSPTRKLPASKFHLRQPSQGRGQKHGGDHRSRQSSHSGLAARRHQARAGKRRKGKRSR